MVSLFSFLPDYPTAEVEPQTAPRVAVGAASPLWLMFGGAAAAGAAYWWWASRWREAVNLEALMAPTVEPALPAVEALADTVETMVSNGDVAPDIVVETVVEVDAADAAAPSPSVEPEPEAVVALEAPVERLEVAADDLTRLVGIGPKLAASLADLGVTRFSQIAAWSADELASIDQLLSLKGRAERDAWIAQAKRFAAPAQD